MKTYIVEYFEKRAGLVSLTFRASSPEEAESMFLDKVAAGGVFDFDPEPLSSAVE